jgi:hypothetical protein
MRKLERILAVIVMVIAGLMLLLSLVGILGTWIVRAEVADGLVAIATQAESRAARVQQGLDRLDAMLVRVQAEVTGLEREVQTFGDDVEQNKPLLNAISDGLGLNLGPLADSAREIMTTTREAAIAIQSATEALNAIPFVSVPVPELNRLEKLSQDLDSFRTEVQTLRMEIDQKRSEIIQGTVSIITTPTTMMANRVGEMQANVSGYSQAVGAVQAGLSGFQQKIGRWLTGIATILTIVLLWLALSQAGLLVLGWRLFSGQDLLAKWFEEKETEPEAQA